MSEVEGTASKNNAVWWVVGIAIASSVGAGMYRGLMWYGYGHSAAMFLGLPVVMVLVLAMTPKAKTVAGGIAKGITFALLIVAPLVGEGYVCILMAAPLFYFVGVLVGTTVDRARRRRLAGRGTTLSCVAVLLLPMCLEGVAPQLTFDREQMVYATQVVNAPAAEVERALAGSPRIGTGLPAFLRIGFPRPLEASGEGLAQGSVRRIRFSGAEGDPPGDLVMRVTGYIPGFRVLFKTVSDGSKLTQWVRWESSDVTWMAIDATHTQVTWAIYFERELDPAWYFSPWERAAVRAAAGYLIEANATPVPGIR